MRLDVLLTNNGTFPTRSKATLAIKEGLVKVNGVKAFKAGQEVSETDVITYDKPDNQFVSRGGYKLLEALERFNIDLTGKVVLDIGASTGGFTDCALQHGAKKVYAYDVGHDQLDLSLVNDKRVIGKSGINCRNLKKEDFNESIDFICMDVSFISCTKMFEAISSILDSGKEAAILFKPQFEVGSNYLNRQGIVTNGKIVEEKLEYTKSFAIQYNLVIKQVIDSPIKGGDGNKEYLLHIVKY